MRYQPIAGANPLSPRHSKELKIPARPRVEEVDGDKGGGGEQKGNKEVNADKALDIRLMLEAADRSRARLGGRSTIYDYDGDSSLTVESWAVTKLNPA